MECSFAGQLEVSRLLIDRGANVAATSTIHGRSALHYAMQRGPVGLVAVLLFSGSDWSARDKAGLTPFAVACQFGREEIVRMMLENGQVERYNSAFFPFFFREQHETNLNIVFFLCLSSTYFKYFLMEKLFFCILQGCFDMFCV